MTTSITLILTDKLNQLDPNAEIFMCVEPDPAMAATMEFWCEERVRLGVNAETDREIADMRREAGSLRERTK